MAENFRQRTWNLKLEMLKVPDDVDKTREREREKERGAPKSDAD